MRLCRPEGARVSQATQTASIAWWRPRSCPGDLKRVFGKCPWCALIPTRHCNDDDIGKGKRVKADPSVLS